MKLVIAAMGRVKEPALRALLDDYYGRIRHHATLDEVEIRDERPEHAMRAFERVLAGQGTRAELVTLEIDAPPLSSEALAARVGDARARAVVPVFALGGADGLPAALRARARWRVSFGPITLPHRLARLVLAEQLYRSFSILTGEPYHH